MNQKELLILSFGVFLTVLAWLIIDLYHIQTREVTSIEIKPVEVPKYDIDLSILETLKTKNP